MMAARRLLASLSNTNSTILLVDEEPETRGIALDFLRELGCRVITAHDLQSAAQVLRSAAIDLIIARYEDSRAQSAASALRACGGTTPIIALAAGAETLRVLLEALGRALEKAAVQAAQLN
jgi:CheY-like chemotaxis protein